jgi:CBS domain-containing protein
MALDNSSGGGCIMNVADIMTREVVTLSPDASAATAARLLLEHGISAAPVVDDAGRLVGILSEGDLLARPSKDSPRGRWLRFFEEEAVCLEELATARKLKVKDLMTPHVAAVTDRTPIDVVASLMHRRKLKRVPVLHDRKLVGIVSRVDLLAALIRAGGETAARAAEIGAP